MKCNNYKCQGCEKYFSTKFKCWEHKNVHTNDVPFKCTVCFDHFSTIIDYVTHTVKNHVKNTIATAYALQSSETNSHAMEIHCDGYLPHGQISSLGNDCGVSSSAQFKKTVNNQSSNECTVHDYYEKRKNMKRMKSGMQYFYGTNKVKQKQIEKSYCCNQCDLKFTSLKTFSEHKKELHVFLCENCNNRYSSSEKLGEHVCFVSSQGEPFKCSCSLTFTKAVQFKLHIGNRPYSCCRCSMQFNRITNLIRHIRTHTKQKPYICKQCGRGFSQSTNLKNHASIHLGVKAIQCNECDFSCKTFSGLLKHKQKHREGFMKQENYIDKRKTSTGAISCPICKKEFPFKRNVGMHMKIHKRKESLCQECGKVFDSKSKLTTHYKACHGVPSICQTCGKTFASTILLAAHEKIHVSGKKFSCTKCCKMFSIKNYLVQHMRTHSEGKQFSCNKCGKLFKVAVSLKYHSKICST